MRPPAPPTTTTTTPPPPTYKPTHVSGPFQDRHIVKKAEFDVFFEHGKSDSLSTIEGNSLKNWRK